jgi:hypothetical protein
MFGNIAKMGYVPKMGMDVAGFTDPQKQAMSQAAEWSSAFMNPGATPGQAGQAAIAALPPQQIDPVTGIPGTSSFTGFQDRMAQLGQQYPAIAQLLSSMFMDPVTGEGGDFWKTNIKEKNKKKKKKDGTFDTVATALSPAYAAKKVLKKVF